MSFTLLPKLTQNFSSFEISSAEILFSADKIHHLFSNNSANPASGPLNSVPAMGCEAIQLTSSNLNY